LIQESDPEGIVNVWQHHMDYIPLTLFTDGVIDRKQYFEIASKYTPYSKASALYVVVKQAIDEPNNGKLLDILEKILRERGIFYLIPKEDKEIGKPSRESVPDATLSETLKELQADNYDKFMEKFEPHIDEVIAYMRNENKLPDATYQRFGNSSSEKTTGLYFYVQSYISCNQCIGVTTSFRNAAYKCLFK
jgi:hypothetical protein